MRNRQSVYDKKFIRKTIRFTSEEYKSIQKKLDLTQICFTKFARSAILKHEIVLPIKLDLIYQINRIGNNLNQIAKAINEDEKIYVISKLIDIEKELQKIQDGC